LVIFIFTLKVSRKIGALFQAFIIVNQMFRGGRLILDLGAQDYALLFFMVSSAVSNIIKGKGFRKRAIIHDSFPMGIVLFLVLSLVRQLFLLTKLEGAINQVKWQASLILIGINFTALIFAIFLNKSRHSMEVHGISREAVTRIIGSVLNESGINHEVTNEDDRSKLRISNGKAYVVIVDDDPILPSKLDIKFIKLYTLDNHKKILASICSLIESRVELKNRVRGISNLLIGLWGIVFAVFIFKFY
jgi:hypothetical protein